MILLKGVYLGLIKGLRWFCGNVVSLIFCSTELIVGYKNMLCGVGLSGFGVCGKKCNENIMNSRMEMSHLRRSNYRELPNHPLTQVVTKISPLRGFAEILIIIKQRMPKSWDRVGGVNYL